MKDLIKTYRLFLAEKLLYWAMKIMPMSTEQMWLSQFLAEYSKRTKAKLEKKKNGA